MHVCLRSTACLSVVYCMVVCGLLHVCLRSTAWVTDVPVLLIVVMTVLFVADYQTSSHCYGTQAC